MTVDSTSRGADHQGVDAEKVRLRVRALLDKAERTTFPDEAEAFVAKAHELMTRHRIAAADRSGGVNDATVAVEHVVLSGGSYVRVRRLLLSGLAKRSGCMALYRVDENGTSDVELWGTSSNLAAARSLFVHLDASMASSARLLKGRSAGETRSMRHSFMVGFTYRILDRLEHVEAEVQAGAPGSALVLRDDFDRAAEACRAAHPNTTNSRGPRASSHRGFEAGVQRADQADLGGDRLDARTQLPHLPSAD